MMRPRTLRAGVLAGALSLAVPAAAAAPATAQTEAREGEAPTAGAADSRLGVRAKRLHVTRGARARVSGRVRPAAAGLRVTLQVRRDGDWRTVARDRTNARGAYVLRERAGATASLRARVRLERAATHRAATRTLGRLNVYRYAQASWYGPGLYGNSLGCGGRLAPGRLGVAHKSLPCGTQVALRHRGTTVRVPVIDRGPYVGGREYDLTEATAQRLGFQGHGAILVTR